LYRLDTLDGVEDLGLAEERDEGKVLFVEWGEPWEIALGGDGVAIELTLSPRRARVHSTGPVSACRVEALVLERIR
jgi:tRNA A37 threonylcarbamoyladenosine biosynthesis protein TsaE